MVTKVRTAGSRRLNPDVDGDVDFHDFLLKRARIRDVREELIPGGTISGAVAVDLSTGNVFHATLAGAIQIEFNGVPPSGEVASVTLILDNPGAGAITWPASVDFGDDGAPSGLPNPGRIHVALATLDGGVSWDAVLAFIRSGA